MMTLEELDADLSGWQQSVATVVANVYELYEHPVYRALSGSAGASGMPLTGITRQRVEPALASVRHLLLCATDIKDVVERASRLRQTMPLLFREDKIREIERLLRGPSLPTPAVGIPLMDRGLLSDAAGAARALSIQQMLDGMTPAFEAAKRTISEVERAWATLGAQLAAACDEIASLQRLNGSAGVGDAPELPDLQRRIEAAREKVRLDPLDAAQAVENGITPALRQARARLEVVAAGRRQAGADLAQARQLQDELSKIHALALTASAERQLKVATAGTRAPADPSALAGVDSCRRWLEQLDALMAAPANWQAARIGLRRWLETARRHLAHDQTVWRENRALIDERLELRGRLDALTAKAAGHALAEDTLLAADARAARSLLYRRPTPLAEARDLVARYQMRLNEKIVSPPR